MNVQELLAEPVGYMPPARALEALRADLADQRIPGANHSIAEIVAHAAFWQDWFCQRCDGVAAPMVQAAAAGWPAVTAGSWPDVEAQFLDGLARAVAFADRGDHLDDPITPAIEFPALAGYSVRDALIHLASHNAHHLGQVVVLRQILGSWPPPAGSWTW